MKMKLQDLTTSEGINALIGITGGTSSFYNQPSRALGVQQVAQSAINNDPNMAYTNVQVMPNLPNAYYNYDKNEIILGLANPDALAHELGHANNLKQEGLYQKILRAAQGVTRINNIAAIPTVLALRLFMKDPEKRKDILNTLSAFSVAAAAPELFEEASASVQALQNSPDKMKALQTLGPAFLAHAAQTAAPALIYQAGR